MSTVAESPPPPLPAWVETLRPRTEAEAVAVKRQVEHIRARLSIVHGERPAPLATVGEVILRNAYREHAAIGAALARLDWHGVQDMTQEAMQ